MATTAILDGPHPWPFSQAELTAGLRRKTGDPTLRILSLDEHEIPFRIPGVGRIRGLQVVCRGATGEYTFDLVLKEARMHGVTRAGIAHAGQREIAFYHTLTEQLPARVPTIFAADALGDWLVLDLFSGGRAPESWTAADYLLATDQLVALHDRFWGLGDDLRVYPWLARPLDADLNVHIQVATAAVDRLLGQADSSLAMTQPDLGILMGRLLRNASKIAGQLKQEPATLLHGDYWPGNVHVDPDGRLTVFDWQQAGIGPGIIDLVNFIQTSRWWFDPLPVTMEQINSHYRQGIQQASGKVWSDEGWQSSWGHALLWVFLMNWLEVLANTPTPLLETRYQQIEQIWLQPVRQAVETLLGDENR